MRAKARIVRKRARQRDNFVVRKNEQPATRAQITRLLVLLGRFGRQLEQLTAKPGR